MNRIVASHAFRTTLLGLASAVFASVAMAQAPATAPAGAMGLCKDGTYSMDKTKSGACSGHKGVKTWYAGKAAKGAAAMTAPAMAAPATAAAATPATPAKPMTAPAKAAKTAAAPMTAAAGGAPGMVWENTQTKVYHCYGSKYYGKTKKGEYMTEAAAKTAGAHADHGKACS
jgi:hypothetical protein